MNESKEFDTIDDYHMRDDKKYKQKIDDVLRQINVLHPLCRTKPGNSPTTR